MAALASTTVYQNGDKSVDVTNLNITGLAPVEEGSEDADDDTDSGAYSLGTLVAASTAPTLLS